MINRHIFLTRILTGATALAGGLIVATSAMSFARAEDATSANEKKGVELEEIVVTSRRYEESIQDVALSVNVMTNDYLRTQGITTVNDVIDFSPGGAFVAFNKMQHEYSMRGINSQSEGSSGDSSVQTVIDNVVITKDFLKNPAMFDVSRVEILRGPQGTSFGRNASAGLIHILTNRPTDEFEAGFTASADTFNSFGIEGFVSGPLSETVSGRLAVNYDYTDGYMKRTSTGERLNGEENFAIRGSLLYNPTDDFQVFLKVEYNKDDDETSVRRSSDCTQPTLDGTGNSALAQSFGPAHPAWVDDNGNPFVYFDSCKFWETEISEGDFFVKREMVNVSAEMVYSINESVMLTSVTGYIDGNNDYLVEGNGTPRSVMFQKNKNDAWIFSEEMRLDNHASSDALRWLFGLYYMQDSQDRLDENRFYIGENAFGLNRIDTINTRINKGATESIGIFGEVSYDITDNLTATGGIRWSKDNKDYTSQNFGFGRGAILEGFADCTFFPPGGLFNCGTNASEAVGLITPVSTSGSWSKVNYKGTLEYKLDDAKLLYALISSGYKTGGFQNEPFLVEDQTTPYGAETSTNYEIGFKGDFGNQFRLNASAYYISYANMQILQFITQGEGFSQIVKNTKGADVYGIELEAVFQVTEDFRLTGTMSAIDSAFKGGTLVSFGPGDLVDISGTRPDNAPKWTGTFIAEYDIQLNNGSIVTVRGDWRGRSGVFDDLGEVPERLRPGVDKIGARITYQPENEAWSFSVFGKNLTNEADIINIGPPQPNNLQRPVAYAAPRSFGVVLNARF
ncbi:TonB-dependent receptor [hydrothermal vent metagenome]|uniref:TonB-dependent receptor n=1 Tax=hydrothermal vent metagenome TaxID=652676 RepID=A0A3B0R6N3_9ZZZZ